jgi:hypothetical protein
MRLIDADAFSAVMKQRQDAVKEWLSKGKDDETCARAESAYVMLCEVKLFLDQMPTIDAVEVVRCKDCKYADVLITGNIYCKHFNEWHLHGTDWFCADGERRDQCSSQDS